MLAPETVTHNPPIAAPTYGGLPPMLQWNLKVTAVLTVTALVALASELANFTWHAVNFTW